MNTSTMMPYLRWLPAAMLTLPAVVLMANDAVAASGESQLLAHHSRAVTELQGWYRETVNDCGSPEDPAYLCSGILLRATATSAGSLSWEPSDRQSSKGSVAFSWVRQDVGFGQPFDRRNGLILYPNHAVPNGKLDDLSILCSFPINANTNDRPSRQGCGPRAGHEQTTDVCQNLGITTVQKWLDSYPNAGTLVCGWELRDEHAINAAGWFMTGARTHQALPDPQWAQNNEVLVSVWPKGSGDVLPVHSFFHVAGEREALVKAQHDQIQYHRHYGQTIPIVQLDFPDNKEGQMSFGYDVLDQAVGQPVQVGLVDFEDAPLGPQKRVVSGRSEFLLTGDRSQVSDRPHPASNGRIRGRHISVDSSITFTLEGAGRRRVSFSWGCNDYCVMYKIIAGESITLVDVGEEGPMRYGVMEFILDGPEVIYLSAGGSIEGMEMLLDNLNLRELPE